MARGRHHTLICGCTRDGSRICDAHASIETASAFDHLARTSACDRADDRKRNADRVDGFDRDDLGTSPDY